MAFVARTLLQAIERLQREGKETEINLVAKAAGLTHRQVSDSCGILVEHGLIVRDRPGCYQLTEAGNLAITQGESLKSGPKAAMPRQLAIGIRLKAWRVMRIKQKFSLADLLAIVCDGSERDAESNLGKYLRALCQAGFLTLLPKREKGKALSSSGYYRYLLKLDNGPKAPVWRQKSQAVYDPNTGLEHPMKSSTQKNNTQEA